MALLVHRLYRTPPVMHHRTQALVVGAEVSLCGSLFMSTHVTVSLSSSLSNTLTFLHFFSLPLSLSLS